MALLVPLLAGLVGLVTGFRMTRLPEPGHGRDVEKVQRMEM